MNSLKWNSMRNLALAGVMFISALHVAAQEESSKHDKKHAKMKKEKIDAMRVGFITEKLDLNAEEAQKFWPVYNAYHKELDTHHEAQMKAHHKHDKKDFEKMSDAELDKAIMNHFDREQKKLDLRKAYHDKFKAVLPTQKVAKLYHAEREFKRNLLRKMKSRDARHIRKTKKHRREEHLYEEE